MFSLNIASYGTVKYNWGTGLGLVKCVLAALYIIPSLTVHRLYWLAIGHFNETWNLILYTLRTEGKIGFAFNYRGIDSIKTACFSTSILFHICRLRFLDQITSPKVISYNNKHVHTHKHTHTPVSYTHLDVYKRQGQARALPPVPEVRPSYRRLSQCPGLSTLFSGTFNAGLHCGRQDQIPLH